MKWSLEIGHYPSEVWEGFIHKIVHELVNCAKLPQILATKQEDICWVFSKIIQRQSC